MNVVSLVESVNNGEKKYKISGIFATIGQKNGNGRVYPRDLWVREVNRFQEEIAKNSINTLMEWEHPENRVEVKPANAVAKITDLKIEDNVVLGEAVILDCDQSKTLKSLIDNGVQISVSSRSVGEVDNKGNVKDFKLITFDIVGYPSDQNATMYGIFESYDKYSQYLKESKSQQEKSLVENLKQQIKLLKEKNQELLEYSKEDNMPLFENDLDLDLELAERRQRRLTRSRLAEDDLDDLEDEFEDDLEEARPLRRSLRSRLGERRSLRSPLRRRLAEEDYEVFDEEEDLDELEETFNRPSLRSRRNRLTESRLGLGRSRSLSRLRQRRI